MTNPGRNRRELCRETRQSGETMLVSWAEGDPPHCWYGGDQGHNTECGMYLAVLRSGLDE